MDNRTDRNVDWDGAANARDLGGIPLAGGAAVAPGRIFRMGRSEWLTERGWARARAAGVRTVVDLRNDTEHGRRASDPHVAPAAVDGLTFLTRPTQDANDPDFTALTGPYMDFRRAGTGKTCAAGRRRSPRRCAPSPRPTTAVW